MAWYCTVDCTVLVLWNLWAAIQHFSAHWAECFFDAQRLLFQDRSLMWNATAKPLWRNVEGCQTSADIFWPGPRPKENALLTGMSPGLGANVTYCTRAYECDMKKTSGCSNKIANLANAGDHVILVEIYWGIGWMTRNQHQLKLATSMDDASPGTPA